MFTGIVDGIATVISLIKKQKFHRYTIFLSSKLSKNLKIGDSVAHNGCCLTVQSINNLYFTFDVIYETLKSTNLGLLNIDDQINVERSLKYGKEIGGHLVSGHIIDTVEISKICQKKNNYILWLKIKNTNLLKYIFYKGFICLDGISLTVGKIQEDEFCVHLIPETLSRTIIKIKKIGDLVNLEIDFYTKIIVDSTEKFLIQK